MPPDDCFGFDEQKYSSPPGADATKPSPQESVRDTQAWPGYGLCIENGELVSEGDNLESNGTPTAHCRDHAVEDCEKNA